MRLIDSHNRYGCQYNIPSTSEVTAFIVGDLGPENFGRDIIVDYTRQGLQRITELHPSLMAMQYPLIFPYGGDGCRPRI